MDDPSRTRSTTEPGGPFAWLAPAHRGRAMAAFTVLTLALSLWLGTLGAPLHTDAAPSGIVSFELARTADATERILASWDARAREAAMLVQGVDFLYLLAYPAFFALAATMLGHRLGGRAGRLGIALAWAVLLAAPLDAVENLAMIHQLRGLPGDAAATTAFACAVPKFALVAAAALYVAGGLGLLGARRLRGGSDAAADRGAGRGTG